MKFAQTVGPWKTAFAFIFGLAGLQLYFQGPFYRPIVYLFSGEVFKTTQIITGGALDQPSLNKYYFLFVLFSVPMVFLILVVRWISHWQLKSVRMVFCLFSTLILIHPLSMLTIAFYFMVRYIDAMGWTINRALGVVFSLAAYAAIFISLIWIWRSFLCPRTLKPAEAMGSSDNRE